MPNKPARLFDGKCKMRKWKRIRVGDDGRFLINRNEPMKNGRIQDKILVGGGPNRPGAGKNYSEAEKKVTGKTNDGGNDGKGMIRLGGVLSFHLVFQAKRYHGSVSSSVIRDFRGQ